MADDEISVDGGVLNLPYTPTPGGQVPLGPTPDIAQLGGQIVRSTAEEWRRRAVVAEHGSAVLNEAQIQLSDIVNKNSYGDCVEGKQMYARLAEVVWAFRRDLIAQAGQLTSLAAECRSAERDFDNADTDGARVVRTTPHGSDNSAC